MREFKDSITGDDKPQPELQQSRTTDEAPPPSSTS
jgi:hypothetical protein